MFPTSRRFFIPLAATLAGPLCLAAVLCGLAAAAPSSLPRPESEGILVAFRPGIHAARRLEAVRGAGMVPDPGFRSPHVARLLPARGVNPAASLLALRRNPAVRIAEPDHRRAVLWAPNDPRFGAQWALHNRGQTGGVPGADIRALEAWGITRGEPSAVVAVLDTGVDLRHPDLRDNLVRDRAGRVQGLDLVDGDVDPQDENGHGTHCAGIVAARGGNSIGVVGVAPFARVMPVRCLNRRGEGLDSQAIAAIDFAVTNGARVVSCSWGGPGRSQLLYEALERARRAGVLCVAAAGNDGVNLAVHPVYPAAYSAELDNVIAVAATDSRDGLAGFSNFGPGVGLAAPGAQIVSTAPGGRYGVRDGTSMAAPHVAGAAALVWSAFPDAGYSAVRDRLLATGARMASLQGRTDHRRLDAAAALERDEVPPSAPSGLRVAQVASTALAVTWHAPGDDGDEGRAARYEVWVVPQPGGTPRLVPGAPLPGVPGEEQGVLVGELEPGGSYSLEVRAADDAGNLSPAARAGPIRLPGPGVDACGMEDGVESSPLFEGPGWAPAVEAAWTGRFGYSDSPGRRYRPFTDAALTMQAGIALRGFAPWLVFSARCDLEADYDFLLVELSEDGGETWSAPLLRLTGTVDEWREHRVSLAPWYGREIRLRFRLLSDSVGEGDGVWLDDVRICGPLLEALDPPAGPLPPGAVSAAAAGPGAIRIRWRDRSAGEVGFRVERHAEPGFFQVLAVVGAGVEEYLDSGLPTGGRFRYRVSAFAPGGESAVGSEALASVLPEPPARPAGLEAEVGDGTVALRWESVPGAAGYTVLRSLSPGGPFAAVASGLPLPEYRDEGRPNDVPHYYVVRAENAGGVGEPSVETIATPRQPGDGLAPPRDLTAARVGRAVRLVWTAPASTTKAGTRIYRATRSGGPYRPVGRRPAGATTFVDRDAPRADPLYYVVTSVRGAKESAPSPEAAVGP